MKKVFLVLFLILFSTYANAENPDLVKIENYLNGINSLKANFVQMSSNGGTAEGNIYISKPSKIRMEYTAPDELLVVGNGDYIIYHDKELDQITNIDYKDIPATIILANKIKFNDGTIKVTDFYKDNGQTSVTVEMPKNPNVKPITLIFDNSPFQLKQWKIIDPQNIEITISLFNEEQDAKLDNKLFEFSKKSTNSSKSKARRK